MNQARNFWTQWTTPHFLNMDKQPFLDLANLSENQRCNLVADTCAANLGKRIALIVNNDEKVIARYMKKIKERNPLVVVERIGVFTEGGFFIRATQPSQSTN